MRRFCLCPFLALALIAVSTSADEACSCSTTSNVAVLSDLYVATTGDAWSNNTGWLSNTTSLCQWYGVVCRGENVTQLQLGNNNLAGTLPESLGKLAGLEYLDLSFNSLEGSLPASSSSWALLKRLGYLILSFNNIAGSLPASWSLLESLSYLDLSYNQLEGTLPSGWSAMRAVRHVNLFNNMFTGSLPASWAGWQQLEQLDVSNNELEGTLPSSWAELRQLKQLDVGSNALTGQVPESLFLQLTKHVQGLFLPNNQLRGSLDICSSSEAVALARQGNLQVFNNSFSGLFNFSCFGSNISAACCALSQNVLAGNSFCGDHCGLPACEK